MATDKKYGQEDLQNQPHSEFETSTGNNFEDVAKEISPNDSVLVGDDGEQLGGGGELPDPEQIKLHGEKLKEDGKTVSDLDKPKEKNKDKEEATKKEWDFRGNK
jgi:hypothetical protein